MRRIVLVGSVTLGLGACASPAPAPPITAASAAPARMAARGPVDGTYRGRSTATLATRNCGAPGPIAITIVDSKFTRRFTPVSSVEATVAPDGTISGQAGRLMVSGTINNGHMEADVGTEFCGYHYTLDKA